MLKLLENLRNPAAVDGVKNKLMDGLEIIDRLPNQKDHNKNPDILI